MASIARGRIQKLISALAIGMLAVAQLPPLEFVLDINNLNYSQQFVLAATSLVISCVLMLPVLRRWSTPAVIALATTGIVSSALGLSEAMQLYGEFQLNTAPGAGIWLLSLGYAALIALGWARSRYRDRRAGEGLFFARAHGLGAKTHKPLK